MGNNTLSCIIPAAGEWRVFILTFDAAFDVTDDEYAHVDMLPVIAFGLSAMGQTVPVTPLHLGGVWEPYVLHKSGSDSLYSSDGDIYPSRQDWISMSRWMQSRTQGAQS